MTVPAAIQSAILLTSLGLPGGAFAQSVGSFVPTGQMITPRSGHTATLLNDGRILIAGGYHSDGNKPSVVLSSAEIYDPATRTFAAAGNMTTPRVWPSTVLLSDGRILILGGGDGRGHNFSSAELYNPATRTFSTTGTLGSPGSLHSATLLGNGKVLVLSTGSTSSLVSPVSAEIYDPSSGVFTPVGTVVDKFNPASDIGELPTATLLGGNRVLIASDPISVYEVSADSLQLIASFPASAGSQTMSRLSSGKILFTGGLCVDGNTFCKATDEAVLYDPHAGSVRSTGIMAIPRFGHTATWLPGGHVLIAAGNGPSYEAQFPCVLDAEEYDPSTGGFSYAGTHTFLNCAPTASLLADGTVLVTGGYGNGTPGTELYIPPLRAASAASMDGPLAPESVASLFGSQLASATQSANDLSPVTSLGGISLRVHDSLGATISAPLFLVSPSEIRFEVPPGIAPGDVTLEVTGSPVPHNPVAAHVNNVAPGIFSFDDNMVAGLIKTSLLSPPGTIFVDGSPVELAIFATGIRNRSTLANVTATLGGTSVMVESAGPDPNGTSGLDQVKIAVPADFQARGYQDLVVTADGIPSNTTSIQILGGRDAPATSAPRTPPKVR